MGDDGPRRTGAVDGLPAFLRYMSGLWAVLAGAAVLFPLANVFLDVIPTTEHFQPLFRLPPAVMAPAAIMTSAFMLLTTYAGRDRIVRPPARHKARRQAAWSFAGGWACLLVFLYGEGLLADGFYGNTGQTTMAKETAIQAGDVVFILLYCGFFVLMTRAFALLALLEFVPAQAERDDGITGAP